MISASGDTHLGFLNRNHYFCLSVRLMTRDVIHRKIIFSLLLRNLKAHSKVFALRNDRVQFLHIK